MEAIKAIFLSIILLAGFTRVNAQSAAINNVVTDYLAVKNSLVADDGKAASAKAKDLLAAITAVQTKDMSADEQTIWKTNADKLSFDSRHISENPAVEHQREHFASLSKNLYAVLKAVKVNTTPVYWQYCPMKKSAWLSETKAIKNPYYGSEMETCGKTRETLAPAK